MDIEADTVYTFDVMMSAATTLISENKSLGDTQVGLEKTETLPYCKSQNPLVPLHMHQLHNGKYYINVNHQSS